MNRFFNILLAILFVALGWYLLLWVLSVAGVTFGPHHARIMQIALAILIIGTAIWVWGKGESPLWKRGP